jgi:hypothetical protein
LLGACGFGACGFGARACDARACDNCVDDGAVSTSGRCVAAAPVAADWPGEPAAEEQPATANAAIRRAAQR